MKIRVFNRTFRGQPIEDLNYDEIDITPPQLLAKLWNVPEADHSKLFAKENLQACMTRSTANDYIKKEAGTPKEGEVKIYFKKIKHDNARKYLGLTLVGEKEGFDIIWREAYVDKEVFLKHRKDFKGNMIENLILEMSRSVMKKEVRENLKRKAKDQEKEADTVLRPDESDDPIIIEPVNDGKDKKEEETNTQSTWYGNILKSPILHGAIVGGLTAAGLFFARVGTALLAGLSIGAGVLTWGLETLYFWRKKQIEDGYEQYDKMEPSEFSKLDPDVKKALHTGLQANDWGPWAKSMIDTTAWKNYKAYGAGLKAGIDPDDELAAKIRLKAKLA